jgi:primosomal replication protein N
MNYFIHDERDLSPAYVKSCKKFLKEISHKQQAGALKQTQLKSRIKI